MGNPRKAMELLGIKFPEVSEDAWAMMDDLGRQINAARAERDEARRLVLQFRKAVSGDCGLAECNCDYCESLKAVDAALKRWKP